MIAEVKGIHGYLVAVAKMQPRSFESLVLTHGGPFTPHTTKCLHRGRMKECFKNAYHLAERCHLTYCEGFAWNIIPCLHAWCCDLAGNVYEPTWKELGSEYYGIPFKLRFVQETIVRRGIYGVIDDCEGRFPLLTAPPPVDQWLQQLTLKGTR